MPVVLQRQALVTDRNLDMSVVLQWQALITDRNLDLPVVLLRQALLVLRNLDIPAVLQRQVSRSRHVSTVVFLQHRRCELRALQFRRHLSCVVRAPGQQCSPPFQIPVPFSSVHDTIAHACKARCLAHVGSICTACVIVIVLLGMCFELHVSLRVFYSRVEFAQSVSFCVGDLALFSVYCLLTEHTESSLGQQRSPHFQISVPFSSAHDPIAHARCPCWFHLDCETHLGQRSVQHLSRCPIFSRVMTLPYTLARLARCPSHVGYIFNECCLVRMSWKVFLVVVRRNTNTA